LNNDRAQHDPGILSLELDAALRQHARRRLLGRGEELYAFGSVPDALFCVEEGLLRLSVTSAEGRESVLSMVTQNQWFGEASLFSGEPRGNDAMAIVDSAVLIVPAAAVHQLVDHRPDFLLQFLAMMGRRYRMILSRMDDTVLRPLPARLARELLQAHGRELEAAGPHNPVTLRFSQEEMSQMLGASRQSINRLLKQWEQGGAIEVAYRSLTVLDPAPDYRSDKMKLRLRQIALAVADLEAATSKAGQILGLGSAYQDPAIMRYGLRNAVYALATPFWNSCHPSRKTPPSAAC
jgi:CRP-like cAMP-binding protein